MSRLRPVQKIVGETNPRQDWRARAEPKVQTFLVSLNISESLCPSCIRPARQVLFRVFSFQRGVPRSVKAPFSEVREIAQSVFLPGKLVAISTYTSFSWCFLLLFLYTVFVSSVPVCNFQVM
jgi:hypothetical protein